jgi:hypothetical protein
VLAQVSDSDWACLEHLREAAAKLGDLARAWERIRVVRASASA